MDKENTNVIYISQISWKIIHKNKPFFDQWSKTIEDKLICMVRKNMKIHVLYTYHIRKRKMNERPANWSMQDYVHNKVINIPSHTKITYSDDVTNIPCCVGSKVWCNPKISTPWCCIISKNIEKSILGHKSLCKYKNIDTMMQRYPQKSRDQSWSVSSCAIPKISIPWFQCYLQNIKRSILGV